MTFQATVQAVLACGFTHRQIARKCEVMVSTVQRWERGETAPPEIMLPIFIRQMREMISNVGVA